jgi:hypothetical protein
MLHSKVYYMELPNSQACAFVGSHNVTSFALLGLNGEASVMLEGPLGSPEFEKIRSHIETARQQAATYSASLKEAYAWWTREFFEGLSTEIGLPQDWTTTRTILLFAEADRTNRPKIGEHIYFELPEGIEQIQSLKTEAHLFLFAKLPSNPSQAIQSSLQADAHYTCVTLGAENQQGNREVVAQWVIDGSQTPKLRQVAGGVHRPNTSVGMQQVRAEVTQAGVVSFEYLFERERVGWEPELSENERLLPHHDVVDRVSLVEGRGKAGDGWQLVRSLNPRTGHAREKDEVALRRASPESGSFILVSLRRRRRGGHNEKV